MWTLCASVFYACIACLPAIVAVLCFEDFFEILFSVPKTVACLLIFNAVILLVSKFAGDKKNKSVKIGLKIALIVGCAQVFAIMPGISRSGTTITAALLLGLSPAIAFEFSFLMSIPAILGAVVLQLGALTDSGSADLGLYFLGMIVSSVFGILSLMALKKFVIKNKLYVFAGYCLLIGIISLFFI